MINSSEIGDSVATKDSLFLVSIHLVSEEVESEIRKELLSVHRDGDIFISDLLSLPIGNYLIQSMILRTNSGKVFAAIPRAGSRMVRFAAEFLPVRFRIGDTSVHIKKVPMIQSEGYLPADFGYASWNLSAEGNVIFKIMTFVPDNNSGDFIPANSNVFIYTDNLLKHQIETGSQLYRLEIRNINANTRITLRFEKDNYLTKTLSFRGKNLLSTFPTSAYIYFEPEKSNQVIGSYFHSLDQPVLISNSAIMGVMFTENLHGNPGMASHFDGTGYVDTREVVKNNSFPLTITGWIKPELSYSVGEICHTDAGTSDSVYSGFSVYYKNGKIWASFGDGEGAGFPNRRDLWAPFPAKNESGWHHVAAVFASVSDIRLYVNGEFIPGEMSGGASGIGSLGNSVRIGSGFKGGIDNIRIFENILSTGQIREIIKKDAESF